VSLAAVSPQLVPTYNASCRHLDHSSCMLLVDSCSAYGFNSAVLMPRARAVTPISGSFGIRSVSRTCPFWVYANLTFQPDTIFVSLGSRP
jgi:hypothetical protein